MTTSRTTERITLLTDILVTAIESGSTGWFTVDEYGPNLFNDSYAVITEDEEHDNPQTHRIDLDLIEKGIEVVKSAVLKPISDTDRDEVLHNSTTNERLYMSQVMAKRIKIADLTDDADLDVVDALAIVECGLFGKVVYA